MSIGKVFLADYNCFTLFIVRNHVSLDDSTNFRTFSPKALPSRLSRINDILRRFVSTL
jgi:hypothetical protein